MLALFLLVCYVCYLPQSPHTAMLAADNRYDTKARRYRRATLVQLVIAISLLMLPLCVLLVQH